MEERIAQLEREIAELKRNTSKVLTAERLIKLLTMIGAVCVFAWGLYQHFHAVEQEFRKTFWKEQYDLYSQVTESASMIAVADHLDSVKRERRDFWKLYWGKLSIVESKSVYVAIERYGGELERLEGCDSCNRSFSGMEPLRDMAYDLARACRESLKRTWEPVSLDDISDTALVQPKPAESR